MWLKDQDGNLLNFNNAVYIYKFYDYTTNLFDVYFLSTNGQRYSLKKGLSEAEASKYIDEMSMRLKLPM